MRLVRQAMVLAATMLAAGTAVAQRPAGATAELEAGHADIRQAEPLFNAGQYGSDSQTCVLIKSALLHYVKAAVESGANVRIAEWQDLLPDERKVVSERLAGVVGPFERISAMQKKACS